MGRIQLFHQIDFVDDNKKDYSLKNKTFSNRLG